MKKTIDWLIMALLLACFATAALAVNGEADKIGPQVGQLSPAIELPSFDNKDFTLKYSARPLIIVFGTSWSAPCQNELLGIKEIYSEKFDVVAVLFDKKLKAAKTFIVQNNFPFPVLPDKKLSLAEKFQILILPTTFCVRNRIIEKIFVDYDEETKKSIEEWLKS